MIIQTQFLTKPYANANEKDEADDTDDNDNDGNYDRDDTVDDDAKKINSFCRQGIRSNTRK